jgi:hypothetical protein
VQPDEIHFGLNKLAWLVKDATRNGNFPKIMDPGSMVDGLRFQIADTEPRGDLLGQICNSLAMHDRVRVLRAKRSQ